MNNASLTQTFNLLKYTFGIVPIVAGTDKFTNLLTNDLNVIVYNFVDMLSHARTEMEVIKELADDEPATTMASAQLQGLRC